MEKEIDLNGRKVVIKELKYLDTLEIAEVKEKDGLRQAIAKQLELSTSLNQEEIQALTTKEGSILQTAINDLNTQDFQKPTEEAKN